MYLLVARIYGFSQISFIMKQSRQETLELTSRRRKTVKELIGAKARFLSEYRMTNYVGSAQINEITLDGTRCKVSASNFFKDKAELLVTIEGEEYNKAFNVVLFDTFIVIEVAPYTLDTEFLVLVPNFESKTGSYVLGNTLESTSVLDTLNAIKRSQGYADLLNDAGALLASLDSAFTPPKEKSA